MSSGYIPIARKFFESEVWISDRKFSEAEAWLDMIYLASFTQREITLSKGEKLVLHRGEFYAPYRQLAKRWGWSLGAVQRFLASLAEGEKPSIMKIARDTHFDTPSDTPSDTQVIVVRLCNYESYNSVSHDGDTHFDTPSDTHFDTQDNKDIENKDIINTHTSYLSLRDLFVRSCVRDTRDAHIQAARTAEEIYLLTMSDAEAAQEHRRRCLNCTEYNLIFWLWWKHPDLMLSFEKPLNPDEAKMLLTTYKLDDIGYLIESIDNKRNMIKGRSLYYTIRQWAKRDFSINS